jgi:hypothetical protein
MGGPRSSAQTVQRIRDAQCSLPKEAPMTQFLIDMMTTMMPFMRPLAFAAAALVVAGVVGRILGLARLAWLAGTLVLVAGIFFLACEGAGRILGFEPTILFAAPADRALYRNQWPFWSIGLALLVLGALVRRLGAREPS